MRHICYREGIGVSILSVYAETERKKGDMAECSAQSAQQKLAELESVTARQVEQVQMLQEQVSGLYAHTVSHPPLTKRPFPMST